MSIRTRILAAALFLIPVQGAWGATCREVLLKYVTGESTLGAGITQDAVHALWAKWSVYELQESGSYRKPRTSEERPAGTQSDAQASQAHNATAPSLKSKPSRLDAECADAFVRQSLINQQKELNSEDVDQIRHDCPFSPDEGVNDVGVNGVATRFFGNADDRACRTYDTEEKLIAEQDWARIRTVLAKFLEARQILALDMRIDGWPFEEIASKLGESPDTVRQWVSRLKRRLQEEGLSNEASQFTATLDEAARRIAARSAVDRIKLKLTPEGVKSLRIALSPPLRPILEFGGIDRINAYGHLDEMEKRLELIKFIQIMLRTLGGDDAMFLLSRTENLRIQQSNALDKEGHFIYIEHHPFGVDEEDMSLTLRNTNDWREVRDARKKAVEKRRQDEQMRKIFDEVESNRRFARELDEHGGKMSELGFPRELDTKPSSDTPRDMPKLPLFEE